MVRIANIKTLVTNYKVLKTFYKFYLSICSLLYFNIAWIEIFFYIIYKYFYIGFIISLN